MDNPIATFLSLVVPWAETGYVNIHWPFTPPDAAPGSRPLHPGRAFKSLDAAVRYINARKPHSDLFVCMSLQAQAIPAKNKRGLNIFRAFRRKELALLLRAFWLDVDIKNGFFRDTEHALQVFDEWRRAVGLPSPTMIVLTGSGGFHVYWVLNEPVTVDVWQPVANALANAATEGFKPLPGPQGEERRLDIGLTTEASRFLRIPDTLNFKHNPPRLAQLSRIGDVYSLSVIENALSKYKGDYSPIKPAKPTVLRASPVFAGMAKPVALSAGLDDRWRPTAEEVAEPCPWFRRVLHTRGAGCSEPEWFTSLQVAYFCQQSDELVHDLSDAHPTYTEEETDKKFALVEENHASGRLGWPKCQTIHLNGGAPECRICPHLSEGKSPLNFVAMALTEQPVPIVPRTRTEPPAWQPVGYMQDPDTLLVYKLGKTDDDPRVPVCRLPLFNITPQVKQADGKGRSAVMFDTYIDATNQRTAVVTYEALYDTRLFGSQMAGADIGIRNPEQVRQYVLSFVEQLRESGRTSGRSEPYGWSLDENKKPTGFVAGGHRYNCAGTTRIAPMDLEISRHYRPTGSLDVFKKNAGLITQQQRYDLITILTTAIGAPLVYLTGLRGLVLHAYGPGGLGKSHSVLTAQSFWSDPILEQASHKDTANFMTGKLAVMRNLPLYYDEARSRGISDEMLDLIFMTTQGRSKGRANTRGDPKEVFEFCTMLTMTSNSSLVDYMLEHDRTSTAGLDRVFEIPVLPNTNGVGLIDRGEAQQAMGELGRHYGHAGIICAEFLGKNIEPVHEAVKAAQTGFGSEVKADGPERWWVGTMAVCLVGARIANKLGLMEIDQQKLMRFLVDNFYRLRGVVGNAPSDITKPGSVERYIEDYYNSHLSMLLVTNRVPSGPGRVPVGSITVKSHQDYRNGIRMRLAEDDGLLRISTAHFRGWLKKERSVGPHEIMQAIKTTQPATILPKMSLTNGTELPAHLQTAREEVLELKISEMPNLNITRREA
jgi:hypothetical protein